MQKKFPSYVVNNPSKDGPSPSGINQFFQSQVPMQKPQHTSGIHGEKFHKPYNKVPSVQLGKLELGGNVGPQYMTNRIRSPTSHFDLADTFISSPTRDGIKNDLPQAMPHIGLGVKARNRGMKQQSQISKISLVDHNPMRPQERTSGVGLQSLNSS